jgi:hypothetical protein
VTAVYQHQSYKLRFCVNNQSEAFSGWRMIRSEQADMILTPLEHAPRIDW